MSTTRQGYLLVLTTNTYIATSPPKQSFILPICYSLLKTLLTTYYTNYAINSYYTPYTLHATLHTPHTTRHAHTTDIGIQSIIKQLTSVPVH